MEKNSVTKLFLACLKILDKVCFCNLKLKCVFERSHHASARNLKVRGQKFPHHFDQSHNLEIHLTLPFLNQNNSGSAIVPRCNLLKDKHRLLRFANSIAQPSMHSRSARSCTDRRYIYKLSSLP